MPEILKLIAAGFVGSTLGVFIMAIVAVGHRPAPKPPRPCPRCGWTPRADLIGPVP